MIDSLHQDITVYIRGVVFNASFRYIVVGEIGENHRPAVTYWQTLSHPVVLSTSRHERNSNTEL